MQMKIKELCKSYGSNTVLNNISFEVNQHEIVTIMGASGIGKSTLLRCICGLEKVDKGEITIKDNDYEEQIKVEDIGLVFQNYNLFPHKSVLQNCLEPLLINKNNKQEALKKVEETLKKLKIEDKKDCYPFQLSGGQKQRVAIARTVVLAPKFLCFDEPTSALDESSIKDVIQVIKELSQENLGILVVTHDKDFAHEISTKMINVT